MLFQELNFNNDKDVSSLGSSDSRSVRSDSESSTSEENPNTDCNNHINIDDDDHAHGFMHQFHFDTMTSEEIAIWVDVKARIVFPVIFVVFNIFYWMFALQCDIFGCQEDTRYEF